MPRYNLPDLKSLAELSDVDAKAELSAFVTPNEEFLAGVLLKIYKVSGSQKREELDQLWSLVWDVQCPVNSTLKALLIGAETKASQGGKKAANILHAEKQNRYRQAIESIKLDLKADVNPDWEHVDYVHWILNQEKFSILSKQPLKKKVKNLFVERGLNDRVSTGRAKHVQLNR